MRENSRVPPSRRSPEDADRPGDEALAASPAPAEPSPKTARPATADPVGRDEPAGLPRRVRGGNGLRPPVRVERPTFSELDAGTGPRGVAAEVDGEPDEPAPRPEPAEHVDPFTRPVLLGLPPSPSRKPARKWLHHLSGRPLRRVPESLLRQPSRHFP